MSHLSVRPGLSTSAEATALTNLYNLATSGAGFAIAKTGANTFANVATGTSLIIDTTTITGGTPGSVLFVGAGPVITQDNTNFFFDTTSKQLRVGLTGAPWDTDSRVRLGITGNINDYADVAAQNQSAGDSATTDFFTSANNDSTTLIGHYTAFGITSSGWNPATAGLIKTVSVNAAGSGYTVGDELTISTGGDENGMVTVATTGGGGSVTSVTILSNGTGYVTGSGYSTTGGGGSGCTINVLSLIDFTLWGANDGYLFNSGGNLILSTDTSAKVIKFSVGGIGTTNERFRMTNTAHVSNIPFLTSTAVTTTAQSFTLFPASTGTANLQTLGTTAATATHVLAEFTTTDADSAGIIFYKSGNATIGSATVVANNERLGYIGFSGAQQTGTFSNQSVGASIAAYVDNTVTSGASADMPGRLVFSTSADGSGTPTDRMVIDSAGSVKITSASATSFVVGPNGATTPIFAVDSSVGTAVAGLSLTGAATGGVVTLQVTDSGAAAALTILSKGTGAVILGTGGAGTTSIQSNGQSRIVVTSNTTINVQGVTAINLNPSNSSNTATTVRLSFVAAADAALTASTEAPWAYFNGNSVTRTHATGALTLQRDFRITGQAHAFVGASVLTDVAAFSVDGPNAAGANATFTNAHGIYVPTAAVAGSGAVTNAYGLTVVAPTGAGTINAAAQFTGAVYFNDGTDATKRALFSVSGISTGTTRTFTLPNASDTLAVLGTAQTFTAQAKFNNIVDVSNAIAAVANAATVPVTFRLNTVTNSSAATLTITMTTASAVDGQMTVVRVLDFSGVAQTITWVNTENSNVTAPTTSNGSTTLFLTVGFIYNGATSKWRCIASV